MMQWHEVVNDIVSDLIACISNGRQFVTANSLAIRFRSDKREFNHCVRPVLKNYAAYLRQVWWQPVDPTRPLGEGDQFVYLVVFTLKPGDEGEVDKSLYEGFDRLNFR